MATERLINFQRRGLPEDSPLSEWPYIPTRRELATLPFRSRFWNNVLGFLLDPQSAH